jgi:hypothetical protein
MAAMSHTIKISDETYEFVTIEAARNGVPPEVWVEQKLQPVKKRKVSDKARRKAWDDFIGAFDSSNTDKSDRSIPLDKRIKSVFGEAVDTKLDRSRAKTRSQQ